MANEMKSAQELLFGTDGLRVSNFKMFPGSSREVTSEMIAAEITKVIHAMTKSIADGTIEQTAISDR